jgi:hypothetical protein
MRSSAASWIDGCSEIPGSSDGWSADEVLISFTDVRAKTTVSTEIDTVLRQLGWQRHYASPGPRHRRVAPCTFDK